MQIRICTTFNLLRLVRSGANTKFKKVQTVSENAVLPGSCITRRGTGECHTDFNDYKLALQCSPVLKPPDFRHTFKVQMDASNLGLAAILIQDIEEEEHVITYGARVLHGPKLRYSASKKECLAVEWAVEKWQ